MGAVIVTVSDENKTFSVDLEVPDMQVVGELKEDMIDTLNEYRPELYLYAGSLELYSRRLSRILSSHETLAQAKVWNGDYIVLMKKRNR